MFTVVGFMLLGVTCGFLMRKGPTRWSGKVTTVLIWILLLLLGVEVGSDKELIGSLPGLGWEAAAVATASLIGSCILAWCLWKFANRNAKEESR